MPLHILFDSLTGNARRFSLGLGAATSLSAHAIKMSTPAAPYLLVTFTFGRGQVPDSSRAFLEAYGANLCGVVSSGSYHWGENFARAGDIIAHDYRVPLIAKINKSGTAQDLKSVAQWLQRG